MYLINVGEIYIDFKNKEKIFLQKKEKYMEDKKNIRDVEVFN